MHKDRLVYLFKCFIRNIYVRELDFKHGADVIVYLKIIKEKMHFLVVISLLCIIVTLPTFYFQGL